MTLLSTNQITYIFRANDNIPHLLFAVKGVVRLKNNFFINALIIFFF